MKLEKQLLLVTSTLIPASKGRRLTKHSIHCLCDPEAPRNSSFHFTTRNSDRISQLQVSISFPHPKLYQVSLFQEIFLSNVGDLNSVWESLFTKLCENKPAFLTCLGMQVQRRTNRHATKGDLLRSLFQKRIEPALRRPPHLFEDEQIETYFYYKWENGKTINLISRVKMKTSIELNELI